MIGNAIAAITNMADDLFTSDEEKLKLQLEEKKIEAELVKGQLEVNKAEAQHKSIFVAGWRPFIGWIGGIALAYQFLISPSIEWICIIFDLQVTRPEIDTTMLFQLILGMLGIAGMRTFEKVKKVNTDSMKGGK